MAIGDRDEVTAPEVERITDAVRQALLAAETADVKISRGMVERDNWNTGLVQYEPTSGTTFEISVNGGARIVQGEPIR